jgi:hypothetical protein
MGGVHIRHDSQRPASVLTIGPITGNIFEIGVPAVCQAQKLRTVSH